MSLQVVRSKTHFRDDGSVHPVVINRRTCVFENVVESMSDGTAIPKGDMLSVWEKEVKVIKNFLKQGYRVQTPLGELMLGIRKSTAGGENAAQFDASGLHLIFHADEGLMDELRKDTKIQVLQANSPQSALIDSVTNPRNENAADSGFTGKVVNIAGARLSFDPADSECGVFFWNGGGRDAALRSPAYTRIGTARLDAEIPETLPPGEYTLEVRTRPTQKDVRIGIYEKKIKVETL